MTNDTRHLTPEAIAKAKAEAQDRAAERAVENRAERQAVRQQRRKLGQSKAREVHERWQTKSKRQRQREARQYAEAWWQALRTWETRNTREVVPRTRVGSGGAGAMRVVGVGNYGKLAAALEYTEVLTPIGWLSASAVARAITESGSPALERLRKGTGLGSLLDRGRWQKGGQIAAKSILEVALKMGDENVLDLHI